MRHSTKTIPTAVMIAAALLVSSCGFEFKSWSDEPASNPSTPATASAPRPTTTRPNSAAPPPTASEESGTLVEPESYATRYDRDEWMPDWGEGERDDGLNTRHEILEDQSFCDAVISGGYVVKGCWISIYDASSEVYSDPTKLDVDHIVPLAEAHRSGGALWSADKKRRFANDKANLIAVATGVNRIKSDKDPSAWLPSRYDAICPYLRTWVSVKEEYGLSQDKDEKRIISGQLGFCQNETAGIHDHLRSAQP